MKDLQEYLRNALERLNNNTLMAKRGAEEIKRSNAIAKACEGVMNTYRVGLKVEGIAVKTNKTTDEIKDKIGMK